jgi:tetratricopeptide (TPR) repeat protein
MEANRPVEAAKAFEMALGGSRQTRSEAAYGQSLAYMRAGLTDMAAVSATKAPLASSRSIEIKAALLATRATSAAQNGRYVEALIALDERARIAPEQNDLLVLRGYAYLALVRYDDAERVFRAAANAGNRDALRGLNDLWAARNPQSNPN